jgi:hypothetical protein
MHGFLQAKKATIQERQKQVLPSQLVGLEDIPKMARVLLLSSFVTLVSNQGTCALQLVHCIQVVKERKRKSL